MAHTAKGTDRGSNQNRPVPSTHLQGYLIADPQAEKKQAGRDIQRVHEWRADSSVPARLGPNNTEERAAAMGGPSRKGA
jgi:hypothetical protein